MTRDSTQYPPSPLGSLGSFLEKRNEGDVATPRRSTESSMHIYIFSPWGTDSLIETARGFVLHMCHVWTPRHTSRTAQYAIAAQPNTAAGSPCRHTRL